MRYKKVKIFDEKRITIRLLLKNDLKYPKKFQDFINSLVEEDAQIGVNEKVTLKEEKQWLKSILKSEEKHKAISLLVEHNNILVGRASIRLEAGRESHIGHLAVMVREDYRKIGLGKYLSKETIKLAKKKLKSSPKIIRLCVLPTNKPAINLYKKLGFKEVARVPDQMQYKGRLVDEIVMLLYLSKKKKKR